MVGRLREESMTQYAPKKTVADILLHDPEIRQMIRDAIIEEAKHKSN